MEAFGKQARTTETQPKKQVKTLPSLNLTSKIIKLKQSDHNHDTHEQTLTSPFAAEILQEELLLFKPTHSLRVNIFPPKQMPEGLLTSTSSSW